MAQNHLDVLLQRVCKFKPKYNAVDSLQTRLLESKPEADPFCRLSYDPNDFGSEV